jgi:hypothetical protein
MLAAISPTHPSEDPIVSRRSLSAILCGLLFVVQSAPAWASNSGTVSGKVVDSATKAPIAGVKITLESAAQAATTVTDAAGSFSFISMEPDTYTLVATHDGYDSLSDPGVVVLADQSTHVPDLQMVKTLRTIANVKSRSASNLVRSGTTSDVYSVNAAAQTAAKGLGGSGSLNQAYGAIASAPGVNIPTNQQGWYQSVYVRGGDFDQVAYELDGLPLTRQSDLAPIATLTSLGSQEVQVYTGGTSASQNSPGLAGYINQVIKTGTYPGYIDADLGTGAPSFYHSASVEASGSTPDRTFTYYVGFLGDNQDYRYGNQFNGVGDPLYFYPLVIPSGNSTYNILDGTGTGPNQGAIFSAGNSFAQATNFDRENIVNLHFAIPHKKSYLRDDVQFLYLTGGINTQFYGSANELGAAGVGQAAGFPVPYLQSTFYNGPLFQAPNPADLVNGPFPSQPAGATNVDPNQRDGSFNGYSIEKVQYQHNFNDHSYLRVLGYGELSNWFINGPTSAELTYGAELADYEVDDHTFGGGLTYANQLSSKNLLTAQTTYETQTLQTYNASFSSTPSGTGALPSTGLGTVLSNYEANGTCYNYITGQPWSCFNAGSEGGLIGNGINLSPGTAPAGSPAAAAGAQWLVTENGHSAQIDNVRPFFSSLSLTDLWQPNDRLTFNIGARVDNFAYLRDNLESGFPARQFWFNAYNNEYCGGLGVTPVSRFNAQTGSFASCASLGLTPQNLQNSPGGFDISDVFQPRVSGTWTLNPDTVIRASYGKYARAEASSYYQYNTTQQNLASFISQFSSYGYNSPDHAIQPDTSNNLDISLEKHIKGTDISYKITPFYRNTQNQIQYLSIDALGGTLAGLNVGTQQSSGVEFSLQKGDFGREGFAYELSYTHTDSEIQFHPINGQSVITSLNSQIELYNSYTAGCAKNEKAAACGSGAYAANGAPTLGSVATPGLNVANPYYCTTTSAACPYSEQPLLNPNAEYSPYDEIPTAFNAGNGYEVPDVVSLIVNYRHKRFSITPTLRWDDGTDYGSPLSYPGYVPQDCAAAPSATPLTPGVSCGQGFTGVAGGNGAIFLPDPYNGHKFDNLGTFQDPSQITLNLQMSYDVSPRVTITASAFNIVDKCFQRGYAWDDPQTCSYSNLPSNILAPSGNFLASSATPVQVKYPYGTFFNITEVGTSSVIQPFNFFVDMNVKL